MTSDARQNGGKTRYVKHCKYEFLRNLNDESKTNLSTLSNAAVAQW